jgi:hypothetical protein
VIQLRHRQPSLWHSGPAKDIEDLWEPWMKEVDQLLEDAATVRLRHGCMTFPALDRGILPSLSLQLAPSGARQFPITKAPASCKVLLMNRTYSNLRRYGKPG